MQCQIKVQLAVNPVSPSRAPLPEGRFSLIGMVGTGVTAMETLEVRRRKGRKLLLLPNDPERKV